MEYEEIEEIGRGGFARVIKVENEEGHLFAKKIFEPQESILNQVGRTELKKRFSREVRYQSQIEHQNVVKIVDFDLDYDPPYFILPLAEGTLEEELRDDPSLGGEPHKALFDILAGLEVLHAKGYKHRDLKPANILRFRDNSGEHYYAISDFGLISGSDSESSNLTGTNAQGGTPLYAAPELMRNFKRGTEYSDVYSFGAILHDIFSGRASRIPYTELEVADSKISYVVSKCTKTQPARRYREIATLREELFEALDNQDLKFETAAEERVVEALKANDVFDEKTWDSIFDVLDDNESADISNGNILRTLNEKHIEDLGENHPDLIAALGDYYANYLMYTRFDFDFCDVLASRVKLLMRYSGLMEQAKLLIALLKLGVRHNRWYVEWQFVKAVDEDSSDALIDRVKAEIEVSDINFKGLFQSLSVSIGISGQRLHPSLRELLE